MALYNFIFPKLRPESVTIDGFTMFLDPLDSLGLATKGDEFEHFFREILYKTIKEGDVFLDLGAHIGYYTLLAARLVGSKGKVFAFEASPVNAPVLQKNVHVNGFDANTVVVPKAVSNVTGKGFLYLFDRYGSMGHSMYETDGNSKVDIETVSLDDFFASHPTRKIDIMKIDVEGSEWNALQGMMRTLEASPNITIFTEYYPRLIAASGVQPSAYLYALEGLGFKFRLFDDKKKELVHVTAEEVEREFTVEKDNLANLMCSR